MSEEKRKPQYEAEEYGLKVRAWRKRGYILVKVDTPKGEREWEMPLFLGFEAAAAQAALQSKP